MPKAYISQITLPSGSTYILKDAELRAAVGIQDYDTGVAYSKGDYLFYDGKLYIVNADITDSANTKFSDVNTTPTTVNDDINKKYNELKELIDGGVHYRGVTTTALTDGSTTNPITIKGESYTAQVGDLVIYQAANKPDREFIWNSSSWDEFGIGIGTLGALAFKNSATGEYTKPTGSGTVNIPATFKFTGTKDQQISVQSGTFNRITALNETTKYVKATASGTALSEVTQPTITLASNSETGAGRVQVVTGVGTNGTDTVNKVTAGSSITVGKKAATSTTVGNANVGAQVTVATGLKNSGNYATTFATNGIKDVTVATETSSPEFSVPTNAASGVTLTENATTSAGAIEYTKSVAMNTGTGYATNFFASATVVNETLTFTTANVGITPTTKYMTAPAVAAQKQGYKLSKTSADTKNVGVDTDTLNKVSESTDKIFGVDGTETFTPVTVGDPVTVIKNNGLSSTYLGATASGTAVSVQAEPTITLALEDSTATGRVGVVTSVANPTVVSDAITSTGTFTAKGSVTTATTTPATVEVGTEPGTVTVS